eukprot:TRINITY_DN2279_c0_g1_i1.p1 TRINITY_DN2279_c0_g1~~TRINITY_DN2279_c0_g1_i1.p1  ORF type:complete len:146 (-),score=36.47 TRINITY_DN2279_c0_g1_i1:246-629(-)
MDKLAGLITKNPKADARIQLLLRQALIAIPVFFVLRITRDRLDNAYEIAQLTDQKDAAQTRVQNFSNLFAEKQQNSLGDLNSILQRSNIEEKQKTIIISNVKEQLDATYSKLAEVRDKDILELHLGK